ncbi:MAG: efflux RND transporter periplasmic adaptor subunit [Bacteroidales bacterium]|nr:efflux RND transporter periplasmic adaptor subunit [Bacteroidales bacterium]
MIIKSATVVSMMVAIISSCSTKSGENTTPEFTVSDDTITVSAASPILGRIETADVAMTGYRARFSAPGQIEAIPAQYAEVGVPFSGRIIKSFVRPGQRVSAGQPLFQISSGDYLEICRAAFEASTESDQADRALSRAKRLHEAHMISSRELEEAQADYEVKKRAAENAAATLSVFGGDMASITPGQPLTIKSPITGTVTANNLVNGQFVKDDADPSIIVADLGKVWVVASVKEGDFAKLQGIETVDVKIDAHPDTVFKGTIYHVGEILDPESRTVQLIVECDNADGLLKPNMFGTVNFTDAESDAILISTTALRRVDDRTYVVKSKGNNRFVNSYVEIGESVGDSTIVKSGLVPGETIVSKGAFFFPEK